MLEYFDNLTLTTGVGYQYGNYEVNKILEITISQ